MSALDVLSIIISISSVLQIANFFVLRDLQKRIFRIESQHMKGNNNE